MSRTTKGVRLPPPKMEASTRYALATVAGIVFSGVALPWAPYPSGWIWLVAIVYVGLPLTVMVVNDFSVLRQDRLLARNLEIFPPSGEDEDDAWFHLDNEPLAREHIARWRRWFPWLVGFMVLLVLLAFVGAPRFVLAFVVIVAFGREIFLAVNVMEWMVPANWSTLNLAEQLRLRLHCLTVALTLGAIALGFFAIAYYLFFINPEPLSWRQFAFAIIYGSAATRSGIAFPGFLRKALRRVPPDESTTERPV